MKKMTAKILAFILVFAMAFPVAAIMRPETVASAASVALTATKKTVVIGNTYTVTIKDKTLVSKTSYSSSNTKVATVNGKGVVTAIAAGTAKITCKVTLKSGALVTLYCTITVKKRVPATAVAFKNVIHEEINAHIIEVGDKYDFNMKLTPTTSTDSTYFTIADSEIASVTAGGIVTAKQEGITVLEARAGMNATEANKASNTVVAKTYIYVKPKTVVTPTATPTPTPVPEAKATGVTMVSSQEIQIQFNTAIDKTSVIDNNANLVSGAISVTKGSGALDYGTLLPKLSADKKSLSLTCSGEFNGTYVVTVFNKVMSEDGQIVTAASFQSEFKDNVGPSYVTSEISDNGNACQIIFNEAIDISNLAIIAVSGSNNETVKSKLSNIANYSLSADRKSLTVDMTGCGERAINVMVSMVGIKDLKGNASAQYQMNVLVQTDTTEKPIANVVSVVRESKTTIVATFDKPIETAGYAILDNNNLYGVIDIADRTKVRYTLMNTTVTGTKAIVFRDYRNYNMVYAASTSQTRAVDLTLDTTPPKVVESSLTTVVNEGITSQILELKYNKNISVVSPSGTIGAKISSVNADIYTRNLSYTAVASGQTLTLTFTGQVLEAGYYTITMPASIVMDTLENLSTQETIVVTKQGGSSSVLPQPTSVDQDITNPSKITVKFANKLDLASAQTVTNYRVNGVYTPVSATVTSQSDTEAVVELIFNSGTFTTNGSYTFTASGVKGHNGTYGEMSIYNTVLSLINNNSPQVKSCQLITTNMIQITLTKDVTGTAKFMVYTSSGYVEANGVYTAGNIVYVSLPVSIDVGTYIMTTENQLVDSSNNIANIQSPMAVSKGF